MKCGIQLQKIKNALTFLLTIEYLIILSFKKIEFKLLNRIKNMKMPNHDEPNWMHARNYHTIRDRMMLKDHVRYF